MTPNVMREVGRLQTFGVPVEDYVVFALPELDYDSFAGANWDLEAAYVATTPEANTVPYKKFIVAFESVIGYIPTAHAFVFDCSQPYRTSCRLVYYEQAGAGLVTLNLADGSVVSYDAVFLDDGADANLEIKRMHSLVYWVASAFTRALTATTAAYVCSPNPANKKRMAKGKKPLFDWHTVEIKPQVPARGEHQGGTHASPRPHWRRGHWRVKNMPKPVWIETTFIKGSGEGQIFKDYVVKTS